MASSQTIQSCSEHKIAVADETYQWMEREQRAQWLRATILGANDGLLSTTSLMLGIGAAKDDRRSMILSGLAGALAGACSMAVGEFVSVSTQRDIEQAASACCTSKTDTVGILMQDHHKEKGLPNPYKAAAASALAFLCGSVVPLASAAFIAQNVIRIVVIAVVTSIALAFFGCFGAYLGGLPVSMSAARVVVGGWIAMAITYGLLKPFDGDHVGSGTD
ncbi:vacuolar iron transporter homolog 5-like [Durio zibethinus]|uniref:Vacuolar iron transporter n=1 Tax=Durio zibethinus TaxID=66656 RepID=A0A6P5YNF9_DURZI|nr:vacuolar iron transporter homolog 5-like [Durio zibethinus]